MNTINCRIEQICSSKNVSQLEFAERIQTTRQYVNAIINAKANVGPKLINKILEAFPDIEEYWLITGKGPMLRIVEGESSANARQVFEEPQAVYGKPQEIKPVTCATCDEKERIIQGLEAQLKEVRHHLTDKDKQLEDLKSNFEQVVSGRDKQIGSLECQIEDLKNNLERLIVSKDEMLSMKDEAIKGREAMLAAKDEIIRIQSKRISELESHRETEDLKKILGTSERIGQENISLTDIQPKDLSTKAKKGEYKV